MSNVGSARTGVYWRQVRGSTVFKAVAVGASFLTLPYTIQFLGAESFGIWATMLTLISWVMLFDIGIGNSLKNKLSEAFAVGNTESASSLVSTAYIVIGFISALLFLIFFVASFYIPWQDVFNSKAIEPQRLHAAVVLLMFFICVNFWLSLISQIYHSLQKSAMTVFGQLISNTIALLLVFILYKFFDSDIVYMVSSYGVALVLANLSLTFFLFREHRYLIPRFRFFSRNKINGLVNLGIRFFVIQIAVLTIFMTDKILITQLLGPSLVMPYEVLFKLFSLFTILHSLILVPLWPAYADAYAKGDFSWISDQLKRQLKIALAFFCGALVMLIIGPYVTKLWIGDEFYASFSTYVMFAIFIIVSVWNNVFAYYVNAINKTNVQLVTAIIGAVLNIPLSIFFVKYLGFGLDGILMSTIVCLTIYSFVGPYEVYKSLNNRISS